MELTLICVGEESKVNSLRDLVAFQHELIIFTANEEVAAEVRNCGLIGLIVVVRSRILLVFVSALRR